MSESEKKIRVGIVGIGNMGSNHLRNFVKGEVPGAEVTAVCDVDASRLEWAKETAGASLETYGNYDEFLEKGSMDAVVVATPHYDHPPQAIAALKKGFHTLIEKPAGVYTKAVREMNDAALSSGKVFGIMYNQRTNPLYAKLKDLVESGELGEIKRTNWIITSWYRPQSYYNSGGWRASWAGEGGGVLLNQDPHQLDLWQWTCGMPKRVRAFAYYGKWHDIEVEDDVTAFVEYENGATGVFVTTTADVPGSNRLEVTGDRGKIIIEDNKMKFWRLRTPEREFNRTWTKGFGSPECWEVDVPIKGDGGGLQHVGIFRDWIDSIKTGSALLAPGVEGIKGLSISNAMHLSSWTNDWVDLPMNEELFYEKLQERIKTSTYKKPEPSGKVLDVAGTH